MVRTGRVVSLTGLCSGALGWRAGAVFAINSGTFGAKSTDVFLVLILAAVFLGGPGEPYGAMLGALVIGVATEASASIVVSDYKDVIAFVILLAMLNGFFTLGEMALMVSRASRLKHKAISSRNARVALELVQKPEQFRACIQVFLTLTRNGS